MNFWDFFGKSNRREKVILDTPIQDDLIQDTAVPKYSIVKYLRDREWKPFGMLVATKTENGFMVGYSLCNKKDKFDRNAGFRIAFGRSYSWKSLPEKLPKDVERALPSFIERCKRYYRTENEPSRTTPCPF